MARYTLVYGVRLIPEGSLDRSLDAFFDLLPGADEEDLKTFGD